jgi:hypothetical protein
VTKYIYPEIEIIESEAITKMTTAIRKEYKGKWYLWEMITSYRNGNKAKMLRSFHKEAYFIIISGVIDLTLTDANGQPYYKEDENQISEIDRVRSLISKQF